MFSVINYNMPFISMALVLHKNIQIFYYKVRLIPLYSVLTFFVLLSFHCNVWFRDVYIVILMLSVIYYVSSLSIFICFPWGLVIWHYHVNIWTCLSLFPSFSLSSVYFYFYFFFGPSSWKKGYFYFCLFYNNFNMHMFSINIVYFAFISLFKNIFFLLSNFSRSVVLFYSPTKFVYIKIYHIIYV